LQYQFKGGTSLLLVLDQPQRFSIDVDIATDTTPAEIEEILSRIVSRYSVFSRWEKRQHKTKPWIPLSSYYLYYNSKVTNAAEDAVMLDVQLHSSPYACEKKAVVCSSLFASTTEVTVPLPGSIIGDKLLTLGPGTLGIPVGKGKAAQRLKHVFDVSRLLTMHPQLSLIRESLNSCLSFENDLQKRKLSLGEVVKDTLDSCHSVTAFDALPGTISEGSVLFEHVNGFAPFAAHLFHAGYSWLDLQCDMARAACCIAAVRAVDMVSDMEFERIFSADCTFLSSTMSAEERTVQVRQYWDYIASWTGFTGSTH
jgi:hypothetical protein